MADPYLVQVVLQAHNGLQEDDVINDFAVAMATGWDPEADLLELTGPLAGFYNTLQSTGNRLGNYIATTVSRAAAGIQFKVYDLAGHLDGSAHGSPVVIDTGTLVGALSGDNLPSEVAAVITTRGTGWEEAAVEAGGNRPKSRLTGRVYVGPLLMDAVVEADYQDARLSTAFMTTALDAAEDLYDGLVANGHRWAVWSRAGASFSNVVAAQIDNAFDTQRRRGAGPTARTTRTF